MFVSDKPRLLGVVVDACNSKSLRSEVKSGKFKPGPFDKLVRPCFTIVKDVAPCKGAELISSTIKKKKKKGS